MSNFASFFACKPETIPDNNRIVSIFRVYFTSSRNKPPNSENIFDETRGEDRERERIRERFAMAIRSTMRGGGETVLSIPG